MSALDQWFARPDVWGADSDRPSVRVNWPNHINAYTDGGDIDGDPIVILVLGRVEFRRPLGDLKLYLQAALEALESLS